MGILPSVLKTKLIMGQKWGQHFLRDAQVINRILDSAELRAEDIVLEIGPGEGVLTEGLCRRASQVHAFEIDPQLASQLQAKGWPSLVVHQGDFLRREPPEELANELVVVANLPYYVTAPILERLCWSQLYRVDRAILMMQEEVAERVCGPASRAAGALSYFVGAYFEAELLFTVPPQSFSPPPKVNSAVIQLKRHPVALLPNDSRELYERLVSQSFRMRRKQLGTSLKALDQRAKEWLLEAGIDPKRRPERLEVQEFCQLTRTWLA